MNIYAAALLLFSFGILLIAILAFLKRKDIIAVRFAFFSISACGWGFLWATWACETQSAERALLFSRIGHLFATFIPITWFHFVADFLKQEKIPRSVFVIGYPISAFLLLFGMTPHFISGMHAIKELPFFPSPGVLYHVFTLLFFIFVPLGFYYLIRAYLRAVGQEKDQLKHFIIAAILGFFAGGSTFLPAYFIPFPLIVVLLMPLYPFFMGISLIRYGLFDAKQIADLFQRDKLAAIGTLATSINHEIRNPLYVIQGLAESHLYSLHEGRYKTQELAFEKSTEILTKTAEQATRAMQIMRSFAAFAKKSVNEIPVTEAVSLSAVLADVLPLVRHEMELEKIELVQDIPADLSLVKVDKRHLEEILFNLIVNSCQAMKNQKRQAGKGEIQIKASQHNGTVRVEVKDNGPGIPPAQIKKIFEPFVTTKEEGTGLGLYITKQLLEKNQGKISLDSRIGKGTTFVLELKR